MKEIWNAILKFLLSKTTLDEELAEKVSEINKIDEPEVEKPTKKTTKKKTTKKTK
jgi:hypothetical protein